MIELIQCNYCGFAKSELNMQKPITNDDNICTDCCANCESDQPSWRFLGCSDCESKEIECTIKICTECGETMEVS